MFTKRKYVRRFAKWRKCGFIKLNKTPYNVHFFSFCFSKQNNSFQRVETTTKNISKYSYLQKKKKKQLSSNNVTGIESASQSLKITYEQTGSKKRSNIIIQKQQLAYPSIYHLFENIYKYEKLAGEKQANIVNCKRTLKQRQKSQCTTSL